MKKDGRVRVCIDFRKLNKESMPSSFPLPHMDLLVDKTAGHEMLSFMDGFSGYNQIKLAEEDQEKTSFTTPWGTYCYVVMPFGLKLGQELIRAMTAIYHDMMTVWRCTSTIYLANPRQEKDIRKLYKGFLKDHENLS